MADNQLVKIHDNLKSLLKSKADALPKNFNETRFIQNAMAVLQETKNIEKMQPISVARTMLKGAFLGLDFFNKECYAIPYGDQLNFQTDYKGEIKLSKKYSIKKITDIYAKLVRAGDSFVEYVKMGKQYIDFNPKPFSNAEIVGVFAVCLYEDGSMIYETMTVDETDHIRDVYSKMPTGKAWKDSKGEMIKKTCLRRLCKLIELEFDSIEVAQAYKDSSDVNLTNEIEYEPITMPTPRAEITSTTPQPSPKPKTTQKANRDIPSEKKEAPGASEAFGDTEEVEAAAKENATDDYLPEIDPDDVPYGVDVAEKDVLNGTALGDEEAVAFANDTLLADAFGDVKGQRKAKYIREQFNMVPKETWAAEGIENIGQFCKAHGAGALTSHDVTVGQYDSMLAEINSLK